MQGAVVALAPELQERLGALVARARALVLGSRHGVHRSRLLGFGSEFVEHKAYAPGDDPRRLDWKVLARADRLVVRRYESDRATDVGILLDRSGSMAFGTTAGHAPTPWGVPWPASKWDAASTLAVALAFVFLRQGDRVGLAVADGEGLVRRPPRGGERALADLASIVVAREPAGDAALSSRLEDLLIRSRRSIAVVVSDLLAADEAWLRELGVHTARGREAWVLHVVDPAEIDFPYDEPSRFVDMEDGQAMGLNPRELARSYRREFGEFLARQQRACLDAGVRYLRVATDQPLDEALAAFLVDRA